MNDYNPARWRHGCSDPDRINVLRGDGSVNKFRKGRVDPGTGLWDTEFTRKFLKIKYPT